MNDLRHMLEDGSAVRTARAGGASRRRSIARRLMSRVLPGGMVVVAALTVPELSVGAGDLGGGDHADDPPLPPPPSLKQTPTARLGAAKARPGLAGVRYAPVIELEPAPVLTLTTAMELPGAREAEAPLIASAPAPALVAAPVAASLPVEAAPPPALVPSPVMPTIVNAPRAAEAAAAIAAPPPASPPAVPATSLPAATEQAAAAVPAPALSVPAGLDQPAQAPTASVAMAVAPSEPVAAPPRIAAIAAPVPAGRGVLPEPPVESPVSRTAAPPPQQQPSAGLRAPVAAPSPVEAPAPAIAAVPQSRPALSAPLAAGNSTFPLKAQLITRVDGKTAGAVDFQQTPEGLTVRIGSVVEVLADRFAPDAIARIRASSAGNAYVSLAELQARGIPISYDPVYDEFNVGLTDTRPKAARKVHIDQISTPERGIDATGMAQVPRPR